MSDTPDPDPLRPTDDVDDDDTADESPEPGEREEPAVSADADVRYRLVEAHLNPGGALGFRSREGLTKHVYSRPVAVRYLTYEARKLGPDVALVLLDAKGRIVTMAAGQTGRGLDGRTRRRIRAALMESGTTPPRERRTSRPEPKTRRTSRPAKRR